jgi:hypothetical protein
VFPDPADKAGSTTVNVRRMTSRRVALTTSFLLLAAGGTAACDDSSEQDETFYCADQNGTIVDEDNCDDNHGGGGVGLVPLFFLWHSSGYRPGYTVGSKLPPGGTKFAYNDRAARARYGLPATGRVGNGTIKTNVVGKGGSGTSGKSGSKSGG